ncbi:MAG: DUF2867 domain-containing protein [Pseudoxanthomonas sp.]
MITQAELVSTFPQAKIASHCGGLPVEVSLIAQLGHGSGNQLYAAALHRQRAHKDFVDQLDEPSTRLAATDFANGETSALFSFAVGPQGHPFHRHAGHRVFTAVSGSGGAQLRFSTASQEQIESDPRSFVSALRYIDIPPDCLFTARFGGGTWHQFASRNDRARHPVFFALSCHTNELGGQLPEAARASVLSGNAGIATLTELLPVAVTDLLQREPVRHREIPITSLSLDAAPGTIAYQLHRVMHCFAGLLRGALGAMQDFKGFVAGGSHQLVVQELQQLPPGSLLHEQLPERSDHQDIFRLTVRGEGYSRLSSRQVMAEVLEGFLVARPLGVSWLMRLRNVLVWPLKLRTSPLGCPVSSLLSRQQDRLFAGRYPVLDARTDGDDMRSQVVLGADDRHLVFRSCVGVQVVSDSQIDFTLGTRIRYNNMFGRIYMSLIDRVHRVYIAPAMLRDAVASASQASIATDGSMRGLAA